MVLRSDRGGARKSCTERLESPASRHRARSVANLGLRNTADLGTGLFPLPHRRRKGQGVTH